MKQMKKRNLYNIKRNFEKKTDTRLILEGSKEEKFFAESSAPRKRIPRTALIAAIAAVFVTLTAFTVSIFSTWSGDGLTINASYYGNGIVWVEITNQSDKDLKLEPKMNLYYYSTRELVESTGEDPYIENLTIPANSTEKVRLDLRRTYDVEALENTKNDFYYLQLTNNSFLLGQKWSCQVSFAVSDYVTPWYELSDERHLEGVLPSLQSYFRNFTPDIFARWTGVFDYVELVNAELEGVEGNIVRACGTPIYFDHQDWLVTSSWSTFDGYNKLLGIDDSEYYTAVSVPIPCPMDDGKDGGGWSLPLLYLYEYRKTDIQSSQDYAFIHGNLLTFAEMEPYKVYDDGEYVVYEMHHLIYTDLKTYVTDMMLQRDDMYINGAILERIERVYEHWSNKENLTGYLYRMGEGQHRQLLTIPDVIQMSRKGETFSFQDVAPYMGSANGFFIHDSETGPSCTIDANYELKYGLCLNGDFRGCYLIHTPTGDSIDIQKDDVAKFVAEHDEPLPRCTCEEVETDMHQDHGWTVTLDWLLEKGNGIVAGDFSYACNYWTSEGNKVESHFKYYPIYGTDEFYVLDCWSEENNKWMLWLVHTDTGDKCDLETEDATAFVQNHGAKALG